MKRVSASTLNASTIDILNTIRSNASLEYQNNIPNVEKTTDIPKVGEIIVGTPGFANEFLNILNRIALVVVKSSIFNNPYEKLKKGYLEFGETVEEIFVNIIKAIKYDPEKTNQREFKRFLPDVKTAFHLINWKVFYPVTIQDVDLTKAFLSISGVQEMIAKIVKTVYTSATYDEFLLYKYLLIKGISSGKFKPIFVGESSETAAVNFRGISNLMNFMSSDYNPAGVITATPLENQIIIMDALFEAKFSVEVLAAAFNMDKATYLAKRYLIDNWNKFDNERFSEIRESCDGLEEITEDELNITASVKAVIVDKDWFQFYDNNLKFTVKYAASGMYWNYFYHTWKTISYSPFANAVCFVGNNITPLPENFTAIVTQKDESKEAVVFVITPNLSSSITPQQIKFIQVETATENAIGITQNGAIFIPNNKKDISLTLEIMLDKTKYTATTTITAATDQNTEITFNKAV